MGIEHDVGNRLAIPGFHPGLFDTVPQLPAICQASIASLCGIRLKGQRLLLIDTRVHSGSSDSPVLA